VFLKCGVRTVQRWEKSEGLPVHRHRHWKRGTVYALKSEIEDWLRSRREERDTNSSDDSSDNSPLVPNGFPAILDNARLYTLCEQARQRAGRARAAFARPRP
jgi:phage terminase Nu1 subunit (DNA packaging protein)